MNPLEEMAIRLLIVVCKLLALGFFLRIVIIFGFKLARNIGSE
jgi:hypothetical protein